MKNVRLNKANRIEIITNFFNDKLNHRLDKIVSDEKLFIKTEAEKALKDPIKIAKDNDRLISDGYMQLATQALGNYGYGNKRLELPFNLGSFLPDSRYFRVDVKPYAKKFYDGRFEVKCVDRNDNINQKLKAIETDLLAVSDIVMSSKTVNQLVELLPNITKYIPQPEKTSSTELVPMETINRAKELLS